MRHVRHIPIWGERKAVEAPWLNPTIMVSYHNSTLLLENLSRCFDTYVPPIWTKILCWLSDNWDNNVCNFDPFMILFKARALDRSLDARRFDITYRLAEVLGQLVSAASLINVSTL